MFATLFTAPSSTDIWNGISAYSPDVFTNFLPVIYISLGLLIGALLVVFVYGAAVRAATKVLGRGRGGGRRGGRGRR